MFSQRRINDLSYAPDAWVVIIARALRTFGYGFTSVLLGVMLTDAGVSTTQVGILLAVAALGSITFSLVMGVYADRLGRKRMLIATALLMMGTGFVFALTQYYPLLLVAAFCGTISPSTNDNTPFSGVEQAILAQTCNVERHAALFAFYNLTAQLAGALGGLAVGLAGVLAYVTIGTVTGVRLFFALYGLLAGCTALLFLWLSPTAELRRTAKLLDGTLMKDRGAERARRSSKKQKVSGKILKLSSLFAVDAFAGGLAVQTILAVWFRQRFGISLESLGLLFFGVNLLAALSLLAAPHLAKRFGLLKTMIIPHFVSNVFLFLVPFMPVFPLAATLLLARQSLSKIDVPARQAFTAALVSPEERTAAASFTTVARSVAVSVSPLVSGLMLSGPILALGLPILMASGIDIGYDISIWQVFKNVSLYEKKESRRFATQFRSLHTMRRDLTFYPLPDDDGQPYRKATLR